MPLGDQPVLEVVLNRLRTGGVREVTLCVGHLAEIIQAFFGNGERVGVKIDYAMEDQPLGTVGPLAFVKDLGEDFLVMNGDVLTDLDPMDVYRDHLENEALLTVATFEREVRVDFGVLDVAPESERVVGFVEKPVHRYEVSMGIYAMNRRVLEHFTPGEAFGFDDLVLAMLAAGQPVRRRLHRGRWLDIGRLEDYEAAQELADREQRT